MGKIFKIIDKITFIYYNVGVKNRLEEYEMKIFKKVSMLLCLCFAFTGVATGCDGIKNMLGKNSGESLSSESSSTESGSSEQPKEPSEEEKKAQVVKDMNALQYTIEGVLENAKSATIDFGFTIGYYEGGKLNGVYVKMGVEGELLVSETEDGGIAMKLDVDYDDGEDESTAQIYYIDDYLYIYDAEDDMYEKAHYTVSEYLENSVHQLSEGTVTAEEVMPEILNMLGATNSDFKVSDAWNAVADYGVYAEVIKKGDEETFITLSSDKAWNHYLSTYEELTMESTLADFLDAQLSFFAPAYDTETLILLLSSYGKKTIGNIATILDRESQALTGASLQRNLNKILGNSLVQMILASEFGEETASMAQAFDLDAFLAENGSTTLDDLAEMITGTENTNWMMLMSIVKEYLEGTTLASIEDESGSIESLLTIANSIEVTSAQNYCNYRLDQETNTEMIIEFGNHVNFNTDGQDGIDFAISFWATVRQISEESVTVALPEGATVVTMYENCEHCGEEKSDVAYVEGLFGYYCPDCVEFYVCEICGEAKDNGTAGEDGTGYYCYDCWMAQN